MHYNAMRRMILGIVGAAVLASTGACSVTLETSVVGRMSLGQWQREQQTHLDPNAKGYDCRIHGNMICRGRDNAAYELVCPANARPQTLCTLERHPFGG